MYNMIVLRFWGSDINHNFDWCMKMIKSIVYCRQMALRKGKEIKPMPPDLNLKMLRAENIERLKQVLPLKAEIRKAIAHLTQITSSINSNKLREKNPSIA
jgi:hypothetical protein